MNVSLVSICLILATSISQTTFRSVDEATTLPQQVEIQQGNKTLPLRIGVIGLVHTHVHWILGREKSDDIDIVGIVEPNRALAERYARQHGYSMDLVYDTMEEMIEAVKPAAVTAFNSIYDHLEVVEYCAPRGIHVMVEKPLAASLEHAVRMAALAKEYNIHLLTNYETTWYGTTHQAYQLVQGKNAIGDIRKILFYTGHQGPIEIGCNVEFLEWLTDPVLNGGGALTDFGCYGANIATWMTRGQTPLDVTCLTRHIKPDKYPKVEDDATIIVNYPSAQVIIMASWNWSHSRKEMEIYGLTGNVVCKNGNDMLVMTDEKEGAKPVIAPPLDANQYDPFAYLAHVIRGDLVVEPFDLSSLENNVMVMQILELAKRSAEENRTMEWPY